MIIYVFFFSRPFALNNQLKKLRYAGADISEAIEHPNDLSKSYRFKKLPYFMFISYFYIQNQTW